MNDPATQQGRHRPLPPAPVPPRLRDGPHDPGPLALDPLSPIGSAAPARESLGRLPAAEH